MNVVNNSSPSGDAFQQRDFSLSIKHWIWRYFCQFNNQISPIGSSGTWREISSSGVDLTDLTNVSFIGVPVGNYILNLQRPPHFILVKMTFIHFTLQ